jgi:hypothetical protein
MNKLNKPKTKDILSDAYLEMTDRRRKLSRYKKEQISSKQKASADKSSEKQREQELFRRARATFI